MGGILRSKNGAIASGLDSWERGTCPLRGAGGWGEKRKDSPFICGRDHLQGGHGGGTSPKGHFCLEGPRGGGRGEGCTPSSLLKPKKGKLTYWNNGKRLKEKRGGD